MTCTTGLTDPDLFDAGKAAGDLEHRDIRDICKRWAARIDDQNAGRVRGDRLVRRSAKQNVGLATEDRNEGGFEILGHGERIVRSQKPRFRAIEECSDAQSATAKEAAWLESGIAMRIVLASHRDQRSDSLEGIERGSFAHVSERDDAVDTCKQLRQRWGQGWRLARMNVRVRYKTKPSAFQRFDFERAHIRCLAI